MYNRGVWCKKVWAPCSVRAAGAPTAGAGRPHHRLVPDNTTRRLSHWGRVGYGTLENHTVIAFSCPLWLQLY